MMMQCFRDYVAQSCDQRVRNYDKCFVVMITGVTAENTKYSESIEA